MTQCSYVFYGSFYEALKEVDNETRLLVYDAINEYALFSIEPQLSGTASALFKLMRPQIDANRKKRENGRKGGSKNKATEEQSASKEEANAKQDEADRKQNTGKTGANVNENANENVNANEGRMPGAKAPARKAAISLLLNNKAYHPVYQEEIERWRELYPAVDVMQELRKMAGWLEANPARRKTAKGIKSFIVGWLAREQDRGKNVQKHGARPSTIDERDYAPGELEAKVYDPIEEILRKQEEEKS